MDVNLSKLQETVGDRGAWWAATRGVPESDTTYQLNNNDGKGRVCLMNSTEDRCFLTG